MRRWIRIGMMLIATVAMVPGCRQYLPTNRYLQPRTSASALQSTADARNKFSHSRHASALAAADVTCVDCHRFDELIDAGNEQLARELSARAQYPRGTACHYCHTAADTRVAKAPSACTTCHQNLTPLTPEDHQVAWLKVHASMAQANPARCESCHTQAFCIDCHDRRDSIQTRMHERNFRFFHSIEARANPMQCGSCHREDFCSNCHKQGNVGGAP